MRHLSHIVLCLFAVHAVYKHAFWFIFLTTADLYWRMNS